MESERADLLAKLNVMKSNLLSIDCGLQKSLHDLSGFKERLSTINSEPFVESTFNNHTDIISQGLINEQVLSLKKALTCKQAELEQVLAEKNSMAIRVESLEVIGNLFCIYYIMTINFNVFLLYNTVLMHKLR